MKVREDSITEVIEDVAQRMGDPKYISGEVDLLSARQPTVIQYVVAHKQDLDLEEIIQLLFQISVVQKIIGQATGRAPSLVGFRDLDAACKAAPDLEALTKTEDDLACYIFSNLEMSSKEANKVAGEILAHVSRAMLDLAS